MKAYIAFCGDPSDGCLLVYAKNRNQARYRSTVSMACLFEWEYGDISAIRKPDFDQYVDQVKGNIVDCNDDLPEGVEFYSDIVI